MHVPILRPCGSSRPTRARMPCFIISVCNKHVCVRVCMYVCIYVYVYVCMHACICICVPVHVFSQTGIWVWTCWCAYIEQPPPQGSTHRHIIQTQILLQKHLGHFCVWRGRSNDVRQECTACPHNYGRATIDCRHGHLTTEKRKGTGEVQGKNRWVRVHMASVNRACMYILEWQAAYKCWRQERI